MSPQTVLKRSYRDFNPGVFLQDLLIREMNSKVVETDNIKVAAGMFRDIFSQVLNNHTSVKIF